VKLAHRIIAVASLGVAAIAGGLPALAATTDPVLLIYRFPGARDDGGADFTGISTTVLCTNTSSATETIQIAVRRFDTTLGGTTAVSTVAPVTRLLRVHIRTAYGSRMQVWPQVL
jgi:hypothetical protein